MTTDVLRRLDGVTARAMFGGHGLYLEGVIFGILADEVVYFKADESSRGQYEKLGSKPFSYEAARGKRVSMSYWEVPSKILEDADLVAEWARQSAKISKKNKKEARR